MGNTQSLAAALQHESQTNASHRTISCALGVHIRGAVSGATNW